MIFMSFKSQYATSY